MSDCLEEQIHEKDVLRYSVVNDGELCVMMDSLMRRPELSATLSDTGLSQNDLIMTLSVQVCICGVGKKSNPYIFNVCG